MGWKLCKQTSYWSKTVFFSLKNRNKFLSQNNVPKYRPKRTWTSLLSLVYVQFISGPYKCQLNKLWLGHTLSKEPYLKRRGKWCRSLTTVVNTIMAVCEVGSSPRSWYIVYFVAFERRCSIVVRCKAGCNCIPHCGVLNWNQITVERLLTLIPAKKQG